jgi:DNA mismatch repair protein MutS
LLLDIKEFIDSAKSLNPTSTFKSHLDEILDFVSSKVISGLLNKPPEKTKDLTNNQINRFDNHFRVREKEAFRNLLTIVYEIDFLQTMSQLVRQDGYSLPVFVRDPGLVFETSDAFHPFLDQPVKNSYTFNSSSNLCFLTGPNMSGKSTFLKTMGLLTYLAHLGLPVPAKEFKTSVFNGLFSTINLSDDLNLGYSHFYSKVNRVKEIANLLSSEKNLVIIFDELFRGTNVKDAYDASLKVISSLNKIQTGFFFISTHILEVAENIDNREAITFKCFESDLIDNMPVYDYRLKTGISRERVGMRILEKENVIKILDELIRSQNK